MKVSSFVRFHATAINLLTTKCWEVAKLLEEFYDGEYDVMIQIEAGRHSSCHWNVRFFHEVETFYGDDEYQSEYSLGSLWLNILEDGEIRVGQDLTDIAGAKFFVDDPDTEPEDVENYNSCKSNIDFVVTEIRKEIKVAIQILEDEKC